MIERELSIKNRLGLHARAAAKFVQTASRYRSEVKIRRNGEEVDGKSILGILLLAASRERASRWPFRATTRRTPSRPSRT